MNRWIIALLLLCQHCVWADSWLPNALPIPPGAGTTANFPGAAYYPKNNTTVMAWGDTVNDAAYYSVYNGTSWTTAAQMPLGTSAGVNSNISLNYDAANNTLVAVWADSANRDPYYSVFDGTSWTPGVVIPISAGGGIREYVNTTYDAANNKTIALWDDVLSSFLTYTFFDGTSWTVPALIPLGSSSSAFTPALTFDAANNTVVAAWGDNVTSQLYYSVFNGTSWTTGAAMPQGTSVGVGVILALTYDAATNRVMAAWDDMTSSEPYFTFFNGTSWTTPAVIPLGSSVGVADCISIQYQPDTQTIFAVWTNNAAGHIPYYSIFDGTNWTAGDVIPLGSSTGVAFVVSLAYDLNSHQMIAVWGDFTAPNLPFYSAYTITQIILPPEGLVGKQQKNNFAIVSELYNSLNWQPSVSEDVAGYFVYRDSVLIATLNARTFSFQDHNRKKGVSTLYSVTAVNSQGIQSAPANVTIR